MKKMFIIIMAAILLLMLASCEKDEGGSGDGVLKTKDLFGTYEGHGSVTKYGVPRTQPDIKNQRYLFITGDERETQDEFDGIVITFEEDEEDTIWYVNNNTASSGKFAYNSDSGLWEYEADYPLGTLKAVSSFSKVGDEIQAKFVFTQSFDSEHYENPEPSDDVNEFTLYLTKKK